MLVGQDHRKNIDPNELLKTKEILKKYNIELNDIDDKDIMRIMTKNSITIESRYTMFKECGFKQLDGKIMLNFIRIVRRQIAVLKAYDYISKDVSVAKLLMKHLSLTENDVDLSQFNDEMSLMETRHRLLSLYLRRTLQLNPEQFSRMYATYRPLRHKPFQKIADMLNMCRNELQMSDERIRNNAYVLYADADNINRMIYELKTLCGMDMRELLQKRPKLAASSYESLVQSQQHFRDFGIPDEAAQRCTEIFTLNPNTIYQRLLEVKKIDEFNVLFCNPRILRLVHYQNKARIRLEYLKLMKIKCFSLHCLSTNSATFEK